MQRKTVNLCGSVKEKEGFCSCELGLNYDPYIYTHVSLCSSCLSLYPVNQEYLMAFQ